MISSFLSAPRQSQSAWNCSQRVCFVSNFLLEVASEHAAQLRQFASVLLALKWKPVRFSRSLFSSSVTKTASSSLCPYVFLQGLSIGVIKLDGATERLSTFKDV